MTPTEIEQFLNVLPPKEQLPFKKMIIDQESAIEVKGCTHWLVLNTNNTDNKTSFEMYVSYLDNHYLLATEIHYTDINVSDCRLDRCQTTTELLQTIEFITEEPLLSMVIEEHDLPF